MGGRLRHCLAAVLAGVAVAAPARADVPLVAPIPEGPLFTVAGGLLPGPGGLDGLATNQDFDKTDLWPTAVAGMPDGGFVFGTLGGHLLRVGPSGRIARFAGGSMLTAYSIDGLATTAAGDIVLADSIDQAVRLIDGRRGTIRTIAGAKSGLRSPVGVAVTPDGDVLVADQSANRVWLIGSSGKVTVVAGTGGAGHGGDGGPATAAQLQAPSAVAALPDGGFLISDGGNSDDNSADCRTARVRRVAPDGTITTLARLPAIALLAAADGGFLASRPPECVANPTYADRLVAVDPQGQVRVLDDGPFGWGELNGLAVAAARVRAYGLAWSSDGGVLIADARQRIRYWAPTQPQRLAVAITPSTLRTGRRLRVQYILTAPATVTAKVRVGRKIIRSVTRSGVVGTNVLEFARRVPFGSYDIRVTAHAADPAQSVSDGVRVRPAGFLTVGAAMQVVAGREGEQALLGTKPDSVERCRRLGSRRIECGVVGRGLCQVVYAVLLRRDGLLTSRFYQDGIDATSGPYRCRFRRHPHWVWPWNPVLP